MKINDAGLSLIKDSEGCKFQSYQDQRGIWTVGYGHTGPAIGPGLTIDQDLANKYLSDDVCWAEAAVSEACKVNLTDNQFSALTSLCFNIGANSLKTSTLMHLVNQGDFKDAAEQFLKWSHTGNKTNVGLLRRRKAERALFLL